MIFLKFFTLWLATVSMASALPAHTLTQKKGASSSSSSLVPGKFADKIFVFMFENQLYDDVKKKGKYFKSLADKYNGVVLTQYSALKHDSEPNYIALITGDMKGADTEGKATIKDRGSIVDLLEKKGVSWKTYQEDYPGKCSKESDEGDYARKHNPFIAIKNIQDDKERCAKIVNSKQLDTDIKNDQVPQFSFFTPNLKNDGHDTDLKTADKWFEKYFEQRVKEKAFTKGTMFVVLWDEDDGSGEDKANHVYCVLFGPDFKRPSKKAEDSAKYTHYSLLKTIEDNWGLGNLGKNDKSATAIKL